MKNKKILTVICSIICLAVAAAVFAWHNDRQKRFDYSEKSTVAMGTIVTQKIYSEYAGKEIEKITAMVNALDNEISWRKSDSVVARLNEGETLQSANVAAIISRCNEISRDSGGVFDITVGGITKLWSIGEEDERIPDAEEIEKELREVDYTKINIKGNDISLGDGIEIDLGAVGKGAACDMIYNYLGASDVKGAVVSVGGSILAWGNYNKAGDKWRIAISHPRNEGEYLGILSLDEGFVSTSGDYERYFEKDGKRYHHIIDATKGYPAESDLISVTVVCDSGILSDALSTACFILGEEKSRPILEKYSAAAVFVDSEMNISVVGEIEFES